MTYFMLLIFQFFIEKKTIKCAESNPLLSIETLDSHYEKNSFSFTVEEITQMAQERSNNRKLKSDRHDIFEFGSNNEINKKKCFDLEILYFTDENSKKLFQQRIVDSDIHFPCENNDFDDKNDEEKRKLYIKEIYQIIEKINSNFRKSDENFEKEKKNLENYANKDVIEIAEFLDEINLNNLKSSFRILFIKLKLSIQKYFTKRYNLQKEDLNIDFKHLKELQDMCYKYYKDLNFDVCDCFFAVDIKYERIFLNSIAIENEENFVTNFKKLISKNLKEAQNYDAVIFNSFCTMFIGDFGFFILFDDKDYYDNITFLTQLLVSDLDSLLNETFGNADKCLSYIFNEIIQIIFPDLIKNYEILKKFSINSEKKIEETKILKKKQIDSDAKNGIAETRV